MAGRRRAPRDGLDGERAAWGLSARRADNPMGGKRKIAAPLKRRGLPPRPLL
jgi:hypothetical protein